MIRILTNEVGGGWCPYDINKSLGGSEESIVLFASALKDYYLENNVIVYHTQREKKEIHFENVTYRDRSCFFEENNYIRTSKNEWVQQDDIVITFKSPLQPAQVVCRKLIHFSCEVEQPRRVEHYDYFVNPSGFLRNRHFWVDINKNKVIPLGVDFASLNKNKVEKNGNQILYCSSPDRGLEELLLSWQTIRNYFPEFTLKVAYGFERLLAIAKRNERAQRYVNHMFDLLSQDGVEYVGEQTKEQIEKLYWESGFWILPLQNPESELFCLNAVKSRHCGCIPIVNKIGALKETVGSYIPYKEFINGSLKSKEGKAIQVFNWPDTVRKYWTRLID